MQEIVNSFYIKKLLENSNKLKVLLVVTESNIVDSRGIIFLEAVEQLMKTFNSKDGLGECASIAVTRSGPARQDIHIKNLIGRILDQNQ